MSLLPEKDTSPPFLIEGNIILGCISESSRVPEEAGKSLSFDQGFSKSIAIIAMILKPNVRCPNGVWNEKGLKN